MSDLAGLGRLPSLDSPATRRAMAAPRPQRTFRSWLMPQSLDQGSTPHCVAFAGAHYLMGSPIQQGAPHIPALYRWCQENDQWSGTAYDGTSVWGLFRVLKGQGYVSGYSWATDAQTVLRHILEVGPVILGTEWTSDMAAPDRDGYGRFSGWSLGGHAYIACVANARRQNPDGTTGAVQCLNSWGSRWGANGRFWLTLETLDRLIKMQGEACAAVEVRRA